MDRIASIPTTLPPAVQVTPDQSWKLIDVATKCVPTSWEELFASAQNELTMISNKIETSNIIYPYYPLKADVFAAFHLTPLPMVRVVLIGQDPYCQYGDLGLPLATGLSFSVRQGEKIPGSLLNIFKELERSIPEFKIPSHGDLRYWAAQGVLLLNQSLTVPPNSPNAHVIYWTGFIIRALRLVQTVNNKCVFILFGNEAKKLAQHIYNRSLIVEGTHPSQKAVQTARVPFLGGDYFNKVNQLLIDNGKEPIDWKLV